MIFAAFEHRSFKAAIAPKRNRFRGRIQNAHALAQSILEAKTSAFIDAPRRG
jgi:hypothetical protein